MLKWKSESKVKPKPRQENVERKLEKLLAEMLETERKYVADLQEVELYVI